jgi:NADH-quinone oxidoreductase subunit M
MFGFGILSGITFLPLVGALFILLLRGDDEAVRATPAGWRWRRRSSPSCSRCRLGALRPGQHRLPVRREACLAGSAAGIGYKLGVDGISMLFVMLTTFLMPLCIVASLGDDQHRVKEYMIAFLVLETLMIGVFVALDLVLFYVFFEAGLIPMFLIIGIWGGKRRIYASFKFFLYTFLGSVLMLVAIIAMYWTPAPPTSCAAAPFAAALPVRSWAGCRPGCGSPSSPPSR